VLDTSLPMFFRLLILLVTPVIFAWLREREPR
jgi:hypothetical protein